MIVYNKRFQLHSLIITVCISILIRYKLREIDFIHCNDGIPLVIDDVESGFNCDAEDDSLGIHGGKSEMNLW
jgi:hypothetical protein